MIVIGIDSHKDTLVCALADQKGRLVQSRSFANTPEGHSGLVCWAERTNTDRVAIEGSDNYGSPVALALLEAGIETVELPFQLVARAPRRQHTGTKTDQVDALLIARIGARDHEPAHTKTPRHHPRPAKYGHRQGREVRARALDAGPTSSKPPDRNKPAAATDIHRVSVVTDG